MSSADKFKEMSKGFDLAQAIAEADRCLLCHDAPCSEACPAETQPAEFIRKLRFKNITGAIRTIKENNILGGACGVLCPTLGCVKKNAARCSNRKIVPKALTPYPDRKNSAFLNRTFLGQRIQVFDKPTAARKSGRGGIRSGGIELCGRTGQRRVSSDGL